jgi:alkylated DNA repair dioxygenase AlkB
MVISLTLGSGCTMIFRKDEQEVNVYLTPCSIVVLTGESRYKWTHEIKRVKTDIDTETNNKIKRNTRVSLTLRVTL